MEEYKEGHRCHFCGEELDHEGKEHTGKIHLLSECRPDLVEHEIGDDCTWAFRREPLVKNGEVIQLALPPEETCYAYQDPDRKWTKEHKYFYPDGPM